MTFESFKKSAFDSAIALNCDSAEIYYSTQESSEIEVLEGEVDSYSQSKSGGVNLRVVYNGKTGYAYSELIQDAEALVTRAIDNAKAIGSTDERPMQAPCNYSTVCSPECKGINFTTEELIDFAKELENKTKASDARVVRVSTCGINKIKTNVRICNTLGLDAQSETSTCIYVTGPVLSQDGTVKNSYAFRFGKGFEDVDGCVKEAVDGAAAKFGASSVCSGSYGILMHADAMVSLLEAFWPVFSAELAQKKLSLLAGKEGEKIAAECVNITDNPFLPVFPRAFDGEGAPSQATALIENGVLKTLLHDMKTAKKAGCATTANGGRASAASSITVMPTNLIINEGNNSFSELSALLNNGLVITEVSGTHAGVSTISGDFSLIATGYVLKNGIKDKPVEQITIAGNFLSLLKGVKAVGDDTAFGIPSASLIGSPSVLIESLVVSGEGE